MDDYRSSLELASGRALESTEFRRIYMLACFEMAINRLALYTMIHTAKDYRFLPRVLASHFAYLEQAAGSDRFRKLMADLPEKSSRL